MPGRCQLLLLLLLTHRSPRFIYPCCISFIIAGGFLICCAKAAILIKLQSLNSINNLLPSPPAPLHPDFPFKLYQYKHTFNSNISPTYVHACPSNTNPYYFLSLTHSTHVNSQASCCTHLNLFFLSQE